MSYNSIIMILLKIEHLALLIGDARRSQDQELVDNLTDTLITLAEQLQVIRNKG